MSFHKQLNLWNLPDGYCNDCVCWVSNSILKQYKVCCIGYTHSKHGEGFPENAKHKRPKKCTQYKCKFIKEVTTNW